MAKADPVGGQRRGPSRCRRQPEPYGEGFCGGGVTQGEPTASACAPSRVPTSPSNRRRLMPWAGRRPGSSRGSPTARGPQRRKPLTLLSGHCYDLAIGPTVLESEPKGKRVQFPHGRATVISELAGEAGHCCFRQWEGSRSGVSAVSQETCLGIDEARCARERLGRTHRQIFRTAHPGFSPSAFQLQPCRPMKARDPHQASQADDDFPSDAL